MLLMDLNEQADKEFGCARRRGWLRRLMWRLREEHASHGMPPSFDEIQRSLRAYNRVRRGRRVVDPKEMSAAWDAVGTSTGASRRFARVPAIGGSAWIWRSTGVWTFLR